MKKAYINPELEVIKIATQQMLAFSAGNSPSDPERGDADGAAAPGMDFDTNMFGF